MSFDAGVKIKPRPQDVRRDVVYNRLQRTITTKNDTVTTSGTLRIDGEAKKLDERSNKQKNAHKLTHHTATVGGDVMAATVHPSARSTSSTAPRTSCARALRKWEVKEILVVPQITSFEVWPLFFGVGTAPKGEESHHKSITHQDRATPGIMTDPSPIER